MGGENDIICESEMVELLTIDPNAVFVPVELAENVFKSGSGKLRGDCATLSDASSDWDVDGPVEELNRS